MFQTLTTGAQNAPLCTTMVAKQKTNDGVGAARGNCETREMTLATETASITHTVTGWLMFLFPNLACREQPKIGQLLTCSLSFISAKSQQEVYDSVITSSDIVTDRNIV